VLAQWPGTYLGHRYGHRTVIAVSLVWAGIATLLSGVITGLAFGIREGAVPRVLNRARVRDAESRLGPRMQPSKRTVV
jgi:hypothetical protein